MRRILILTALLLPCYSISAEDEVPGITPELEGIDVIGNRELPKALVIVPWKAPEPGDLDGSPLQSLIDEVLGPVDKDVHKRKVSYYEQYY
ncbi:MAG: hypothetical protein HKN83_12230 [Gammaproteobacteria bacterium]|nr:hypothetical protein [Gammaproteobacteria bacterium]